MKPAVPIKVELINKDIFWSKVDKSDSSGCWIWIGAISPHGYGRYKVEGRYRRAHRIAYTLQKEAIPANKVIDHLCRNRRCVNPDHLEPVDNATNVLRGEGLAMQMSRRTHCEYGHPLEGENLYTKKNRRVCRICQRRWRKNARLKKKAAVSQ